MNSTVDNSNMRELPEQSLEEFYEEASSLHYLSDEDSFKETIFSELQHCKKRYWIIGQLNEGGAKKILEVKDTSTGRNVAMAVLQQCENIHHIEDFLCEARITAALQHPNIMPVYDIGLNSLDHPYFTMKLIKNGYNLSELVIKLRKGIKVESYSNLTDRLELFLKICDAVAYAHNRGVIHLDLKPENIQLDRFGQILVCDWGLAKLSFEPSDTAPLDTDYVTSLDFINITLNGMIKGTPGYMAPEQATVEKTVKDRRTDIYSLGAILYTLLSLHRPIKTGKLKQMLNDTQSGRITPMNTGLKGTPIPPSLKKITKRAMELAPENRYHSVDELQLDIKAYLNGYATSVEGAGLLRLLGLFYQRNKVKCNLIISSMAMIVAITSTMLFRLKKSEQRAIYNATQADKNALKAIDNAKRAEESEQKLYESLKQLELQKKDNRYLEKVNSLVLLREGDNLYNQKKYLEAYHKLIKALTYNDQLERAWNVLGTFCMTGQSFRNASDCFQKALPREKSLIEAERLKKLAVLCNKYAKRLDNPKKRLSEVDVATLVNELKSYGYEAIAFDVQQRIEKNIFIDQPLAPLIKNK